MFSSADFKRLPPREPTGIAVLPLSYLTGMPMYFNSPLGCNIAEAVIVSDSGNNCIHIINSQTGIY